MPSSRDRNTPRATPGGDLSFEEGPTGSFAVPPPLSLDQAAGRTFDPTTAEDTTDGRGPARYLPADPDASGALEPGTTFPVIGKGGLGHVLAAYDAQLGRVVALKEMSPRAVAAGGAVAVERFLREARVTARLEHPSIVPVHELARRPDGAWYYTMKHVRGRTLTAAIRACTTTQQRLALLGHMADLCQALAYAHSRGVVHRDVKPDNVMVGEFGETMVLDWGIAKVRGEGELDGDAAATFSGLESGATLAGSVLGTPAYMSPEQARGQVDLVDERSDTWSLGAVLFDLLTGRHLFEGSDPIAVLEEVKAACPRPVRAVCPDLPGELAAIVDRALAPDRALRYADAGELARDVEAYRAGALVQAYRYSPWDHLRRFAARHRVALAVGLAAALLLAGLGTWAVTRIVPARDHALAAEQNAWSAHAEAIANLSDSLMMQAGTAWRTNRVDEAWILAARAMEMHDRPDARGIVLGAWCCGMARPGSPWPRRRRCVARCRCSTCSGTTAPSASTPGATASSGSTSAAGRRCSTRRWAGRA